MSSPRTMSEELSGDLDTIAKLDISQGEKVEGELDVFITRRDKQRRKTEEERPEEVAWAESVRRYNEREEQGLLWEQKRYHESMIRAHEANLAAIVSGHREKLARVDALLGISNNSTPMKGAAA